MKNEILTRNAAQADMQDLIDLLQQLFSIEKDFTFDARTQKKGLTMMLGCGKHRTIKVACYKGHVVGMCSVQTRISTARGSIAGIIEDLIVDSTHRGMGIGKKLLDSISTWAQQRGINDIQLLADKNNSPALQFYADQKWKTTDLICLIKQ